MDRRRFLALCVGGIVAKLAVMSHDSDVKLRKVWKLTPRPFQPCRLSDIRKGEKFVLQGEGMFVADSDPYQVNGVWGIMGTPTRFNS